MKQEKPAKKVKVKASEAEEDNKAVQAEEEEPEK